MGEKPEAREFWVYQIQIQGQLDVRWSEWLGGMTIAVQDGDPPLTVLSGPADQSTLRGILNRIWDLNLALVSVRCVDRRKML